MATATLEKQRKKKEFAESKGTIAKKAPSKKKRDAPASLLTPSKTVQMNVRIDEETKKAGDEAFARIGLTPSQAVRALWEYAARNANDPEVLRNFIGNLDEGQADSNASSEQIRRLETLREGWALIDNFRKEHNLICTVPEDDDERMAYYEQLREEALWERLGERGLL